MNKRMIILIALALLATVGAGSAGTAVDEVEIRGTVVEADGAGDMNGDGKLTSADALRILQAAAGKIDIG